MKLQIIRFLLDFLQDKHPSATEIESILDSIVSGEVVHSPAVLEFATTIRGHLQDLVDREREAESLGLKIRLADIMSQAVANNAKKPISRTKQVLVILGILVFFGLVVLFTLLAYDVFTIPILTPIAHFLALILSPFVPLIFPIYLAIFLRVCAYPRKQWPGKRRWQFITGCWGFSHTQRAVRNGFKLWKPVYRNGVEGMCGLNECKGKWVEEALIVVVVVCQLRGWKWDNGLIDKWIEGLVKQEKIAAERAKNNNENRMEKGEMTEEIVNEYPSAEEEKRELMAEDAMTSTDIEVKREVLIEVEDADRVEKPEEVKA